MLAVVLLEIYVLFENQLKNYKSFSSLNFESTGNFSYSPKPEEDLMSDWVGARTKICKYQKTLSSLCDVFCRIHV